MIRVLLADDHPTFRRGLGSLISSLPQLEVVGEASTGTEAVVLTGELGPDVVVMDLNMPELNGVEATREIVGSHPEVAVLVLTMLEDDESVFAAMRAGAKGYVVKGAETEDVVRAIESVARGDAVFGPAVAARVITYLTQPAVKDPAFPVLSEREREVLDLLARGLSNSEITRRLVVSPKTVRNHISSIFSKLQVADRSEAIVRARRAGLGVAPGERP